MNTIQTKASRKWMPLLFVSYQLVGVLLFDDVSEAHLELADKRDIFPLVHNNHFLHLAFVTGIEFWLLADGTFLPSTFSIPIREL